MRLAVLLLAALSAGQARAAPAVDPTFCDKLLEEGVRSYVSGATRNGFRRAVYPSLCSTFERARRDTTEAAAREAYALVGGEGEYDSDRFDKLKTAYCTLEKRLAANRPMFEKVTGALNPQALQAWRRCTDASLGRYGPALEVEQIDEYTLSFTLQPAAYDLRSVQVTLDGFDWCSGFIQGSARPKGGAARFEIPILARNKEHDLACYRKVARKAPCGTEAAAPASLKLEFEGGKAARVTHHFEMARVMSPECAPPPSP
jgi:hypothetical protein